jgi:hypothetical protein
MKKEQQILANNKEYHPKFSPIVKNTAKLVNIDSSFAL